MVLNVENFEIFQPRKFTSYRYIHLQIEQLHVRAHVRANSSFHNRRRLRRLRLLRLRLLRLPMNYCYLITFSLRLFPRRRKKHPDTARLLPSRIEATTRKRAIHTHFCLFRPEYMPP